MFARRTRASRSTLAFTGTSAGTITFNIFGSDGLSAIVTKVEASKATSLDIGVDALAFLGERTGGAFFITQESAVDLTVGARTVTVSSIVSPKTAGGTTSWSTVGAKHASLGDERGPSGARGSRVRANRIEC